MNSTHTIINQHGVWNMPIKVGGISFDEGYLDLSNGFTGV